MQQRITGVWKFSWWFALILSLSPLNAWAQSPDTLFQLGIEASKTGDKASALNYFQAAASAGMDRPKLHYNLGVSYYQNEQWAKAHAAFLQAAKHPPLQTISHYNLGLVALQQGNQTAAKDWFYRVYQQQDNPQLQALAAQRLGLQAEAATQIPRWYSGLSITLGYDDNLIDPTVTGATSSGDSYTSLLAYATGVISGSLKAGTRLGASAYITRYSDISSYDMEHYQVSLGRQRPFADWLGRGTLYFEQSRLGGEGYLRGLKGDVRATKQLNQSDELTVRYRYTRYISLNTQYDPMGGNKHGVRFNWERKQDQQRWGAGYELEYNDRNDFSSTTTYTSYSPTRHTIEGLWSYPLESGWELRTQGSYRISQYNDPHLLADGTRITREDQRLDLGLKMVSRLSRSIDMQLEYRYTDNDSNIGDYQFSRNLYSLGLSANL